MEKESERRKRFFPTVSLGSLVATLAFVGAGIGLYTQVIADTRDNKTEIANLKVNEIRREVAEKESRQEIKQDIRDVKSDVKELNQKVDKVLTEILKRKD